MRLLLIRHGQTPSNIRGLLDTAVPGPGLTRLGREQARALPDALAGEPIEALLASTAIRTQLTAEPLADANGLPVEVRHGLREISAGKLEMLADAQAHRTYMSVVFGWSAGDLDQRMPGGPDGHETFGRFDAVVAELLASGLRTVAVVSHGAMIRSWAGARAANLGADYVARNILGNTGVVVLEGDGNGWEALSWMGESVGGRALEGSLADGPAGDAVELDGSRRPESGTGGAG
ncbi:histidine phosphatase family protein [Arthrobacter mobilis]|uniref:Histidine phosphatase family protein n=1 Tax=Arthrobacter mobilis TaxID=2724944 RepID=A0A7X6K4U4_9MICC|nr:histidine phosphatase family protein [Arthrobacter mobilis]NKX53499.1 histidine phosphatase family protein [Arthrobacter mobilis]